MSTELHAAPAATSSSSDDEVLVRVEGVSKKFCRNLKKSLWYGVKDVAAELMGAEGSTDRLRTEEFWAVDDVSFELRRGECLGLIGHNGAGKTTLLKMLNGLIKPDRGQIEMQGRVGALIALGAGFNPILTGRENIHVNASILGLTKKQLDGKIQEIIDFAELHEFIDSPVQNYSSGMQVRLGFAVATALAPDILLLDEVLAVGDMQFQAKCLNTLGRMRKEGASFILVTHNMLNITRYCDRVLFMTNGRERYIGKTAPGVQCYENAMMSSDSQERADLSDKAVAGSGRVTLTNVTFQNADGTACQKLRAGDPLHLILEYASHASEPLPMKVELTIRDMADVLHRSAHERIFWSNHNGKQHGTLVCRFDAIPMNTPFLLFSVLLWNLDFTELYDWKYGIRILAEQVPESTGRIHLKCTIQHL